MTKRKVVMHCLSLWQCSGTVVVVVVDWMLLTDDDDDDCNQNCLH